MTGYPPELLDPELDLEADLGVDTVKQAEVFAAVRGHWNLERDENLRLRDFPTLNHVAGWVRGKMGLPEPTAAAAAAAPAPAGLVSADISAAPAAPASGGDEILSVVTRLVAEMTGYPPELLDPELDLEADLGVDTVKQAEVFAAVRGHWNLERDENLRLRDFPTLNHVAGWVRDRLGTSAAPVAVASAVVSSPEAASPIYAPTPGTAAPAPASPAGDDVLAVVTNVVAEMTGYPVDLLDPELDLEADLGVDTVKQAEVFAAVRGHFNLERDENLRLRDFPTLNHVAGWVPRPPRGGPADDAGDPRGARGRSRPGLRRGSSCVGTGRRCCRRAGGGRSQRLGCPGRRDPHGRDQRGGGDDRLPGRPPRPGAGPGSRPGCRHGQAGPRSSPRYEVTSTWSVTRTCSCGTSRR
jgi:hypothetical protein